MRTQVTLSACFPDRAWDGVRVSFGTFREFRTGSYSVIAHVSRDGAEGRGKAEIDFMVLTSKDAAMDTVLDAEESSAQQAVLTWRRALWAGWEDALLGGEV